MPTSSFHVRHSLHLREPKLATRSAKHHRELVLSVTITAVFHCKESLRIPGICATYLACPAGPRWGKDDRSAAHPAEYILGVAGAIGTCSRRHSTVHCRAITHQSPYSSLSLGQPVVGQDFLRSMADKCPPPCVSLRFHVIYLQPTILL